MNPDLASVKLASMRIREPISSWDLLERVKALAREEPRRLHMRTWGEYVPEWSTMCGPNNPPCGTAACLAGWSGVLISGHYVTLTSAQIAQVVAGKYYRDLYAIFVSTTLTGADEQGTREHVEAVIAALDEFMAPREEYLRARIVQPDPNGDLFGVVDWTEE